MFQSSNLRAIVMKLEAFHPIRSLKRNWRCLKEPRRQNPDEHPACRLETLPTELLHDIASHLSAAEAATLLLCSKTLLHRLGTQYWKALDDPQRQRKKLAFLDLFDLQYPDLILCEQCAKFHPPAGRDQHGRHVARIGGCETGPAYLFRGTEGISFSTVQAAMKQHRLGRDPSPYLRDLSGRTAMYTSAAYDFQQFAEPQIVGGELMVRLQACFFRRSAAPAPSGSVDWSACPHQAICILGQYPAQGAYLTHHLAWTDEHVASQDWRADPSCQIRSCARCEAVRRCRYCDTEFRLYHRVYPQRGVAVVAAAWLTLGSGRSPQDPKWVRVKERTTLDLREMPPNEPVGALQRAFDERCPLLDGRVYRHFLSARLAE